MFVDDLTEVRTDPEGNEWVFRPLSWGEKTEAERLHAIEILQTQARVTANMTAAQIQASQAAARQAQQTTEDEPELPGATLNRPYVLQHSIVQWPSDDEPSPENIGRLSVGVAEWAFEQAVSLIERPANEKKD